MADFESIRVVLQDLEEKVCRAREIGDAFAQVPRNPEDSWAPWVYVYRRMVDELSEGVEAVCQEVHRAKVG